MADTYKETFEAKLTFTFKDGDTRILTIPNPKEDFKASDALALEERIVSKKLLVGDLTGAEIVGMSKCEIISTTKTTLDITKSTT